MSTIEWRTPSPVWHKESVSGPVALRPGIARFDGDRFLDDFLALMRGDVAGKTPQALGAICCRRRCRRSCSSQPTAATT